MSTSPKIIVLARDPAGDPDALLVAGALAERGAELLFAATSPTPPAPPSSSSSAAASARGSASAASASTTPTPSGSATSGSRASPRGCGTTSARPR